MAGQVGVSTVRALLRDAARDGVALWVENERLHFKATAGEISTSLRTRLQSSMEDIVAELTRPVYKRRPRQLDVIRLPDLWLDFWHETDGDITIANQTHVIFQLDGNALSGDSLTAAFGTLFKRYDLLRARIALRDGSPCVLFDQLTQPPLQMLDLSAQAPADRVRQAEQIIERVVWTRLEEGAVFRACIIKISTHDFLVAFVLHHFAADFASCAALARALLSLLPGSPPEPYRSARSPLQYYDYLMGITEWLSGPGPGYRLAYWRKQLSGVREVRMPASDAALAAATTVRDAVTSSTSESVRTALTRTAAALGATPAEVILAAHFIALAQSTGCTDLVTIVIISGRDNPALVDLVGGTVDCLPVRAHLLPHLSYADFIRQVHTTYAMAQDYRVPWSLLRRTLREDGVECIAPIFNFITGKRSAEQSPGSFQPAASTELAGISVRRPSENKSVPWKSHELDVFDNGRTLSATVKYNTQVYRRDTAEHLMDGVLRCLDRIAQDPDSPIERLLLQ